MCTTGVLRLADGSYALFKNKDFGRDHLDDRIWLDDALFGVLGMTTWAGDDPLLDEYSGFSIAANAHGLLCCDSNVVTLDGHVNYDVMTEVAVRDGVDVASAVEAVRDACARAPVSWGNLVMIDATSASSVEIRGSEVAVVPFGRAAARSNHHVALGDHAIQEDHATTHLRLAAAQRRVEAAAELADVYALQAAHDDGPTGICNHAGLTTVYSYVLHRHAEGTTLHVLQGRPCSGAARSSIDIPFGDRADAEAIGRFLDAYPTATKQNAAVGV
jgi:hypothetical protein